MTNQAMTDDELRRRAKRIRLLLLDCDGVLTDGSIVYDEVGREIKRFFVRDGFGIRCWQRAGHRVGVITGRYSQTLAIRCRELNLWPVLQNAPNKEPAFQAALKACGVSAEEVCVMGDDLPDLPLILAAGLGVAVADADPAVMRRADYVTQTRGGRGAIREVIELILGLQGTWEEVLAHYGRTISVG